MDGNPTEKQSLEKRTSVESRKIWDLEQNRPPIIDAPTVSTVDFRIVNEYPSGTVFTVREADGEMVDCRVVDGEIFYNSNFYTKL